MTDPLRELIAQALDLMHPAFVESQKPASVMCEFYHQFRKLWDRGIPVGMGLGHLLVKVLDESTLGITRVGEGGKSDEALVTVGFVTTRLHGDFKRSFAVECCDGRFRLIC